MAAVPSISIAIPAGSGSMNACLAGLDLVELLLQVSSGKGELRRVQLIEREVVA